MDCINHSKFEVYDWVYHITLDLVHSKSPKQIEQRIYHYMVVYEVMGVPQIIQVIGPF